MNTYFGVIIWIIWYSYTKSLSIHRIKIENSFKKESLKTKKCMTFIIIHFLN